MNYAERQALREKHEQSGDWCVYCAAEWYPCDVIKVLDFAEWVVNELKDISAGYEGEL